MTSTLHGRAQPFEIHPLRIPLTATSVGALALALASAPPVHAATASTTFNVTATVAQSCAVTASDLAFGAYDPGSATDKTGTSTISVNCSLGTVYTVSLNNGANASGNTRRMASGAERLTYQIYQDIGATLVLGSVANLLGLAGIGTGVAAATTIYGVIPKTQNVGSGSYSDQITVTVDY